MKLKDLVIRKKQLQMKGKKIEIESKEPNSFKNIEKTGTLSQKEVLENLRKRSKDKE